MVKQLLLPFIGVAVFIILVGLLVKNSGNIKIPNFNTETQTSSSQTSEKTIKINDTTIKVELADTADSRSKGLSGRTSLPTDSGMLFIFDALDKTPNFWMKDMLIPLDLVWIRDGMVVKIDKNVQPPKANTPDSSLLIYAPGMSIDHVLEVNGGYSDAKGIKVSSPVDLSGI